LLLINIAIIFLVSIYFRNLSISVWHIFIVGLDCASLEIADFCSHRALSYFERMTNDCIFFFVVKCAFLDFVLGVLAADRLVDEYQDDEANDASETKKHDK